MVLRGCVVEQAVPTVDRRHCICRSRFAPPLVPRSCVCVCVCVSSWPGVCVFADPLEGEEVAPAPPAGPLQFEVEGSEAGPQTSAKFVTSAGVGVVAGVRVLATQRPGLYTVNIADTTVRELCALLVTSREAVSYVLG